MGLRSLGWVEECSASLRVDRPMLRRPVSGPQVKRGPLPSLSDRDGPLHGRQPNRPNKTPSSRPTP